MQLSLRGRDVSQVMMEADVKVRFRGCVDALGSSYLIVEAKSVAIAGRRPNQTRACLAQVRLSAVKSK
jgi:hypothetical protein